MMYSMSFGTQTLGHTHRIFRRYHFYQNVCFGPLPGDSPMGMSVKKAITFYIVEHLFNSSCIAIYR